MQQQHFTVTLYSYILQLHFTVTFYSYTLQLHFTVTLYSYTLQLHFTVTLYSYTLQFLNNHEAVWLSTDLNCTHVSYVYRQYH